MWNDRRSWPRLSSRARIAAGGLAALGLGAALFVLRGGAPAPATPVTVESSDLRDSISPARPPSARIDPRRQPSAAGTQALPPDVVRTLQGGSQEPLVPKELHVNVEVAPRGKLTAEPLEPKVLELPEPVPARGGTVTTEPLEPKVLEVTAE